jgi:hypothetical protein
MKKEFDFRGNSGRPREHNDKFLKGAKSSGEASLARKRDQSSDLESFEEPQA